MTAPDPSIKAAVSVSELAELCGISRSRWYELVEAGVFPAPVTLAPLKRPVYDRTLIEKCLEIKRTGISLGGTPVVWNRKLSKASSARSKTKSPATEKPIEPCIEPILDAVKALGLTPTAQAVNDAIATLYPTGISGQEQGDVIRKTFLYLQGKRP